MKGVCQAGSNSSFSLSNSSRTNVPPRLSSVALTRSVVMTTVSLATGVPAAADAEPAGATAPTAVADGTLPFAFGAAPVATGLVAGVGLSSEGCPLYFCQESQMRNNDIE